VAPILYRRRHCHAGCGAGPLRHPVVVILLKMTKGGANIAGIMLAFGATVFMIGCAVALLR